MLTSQKLSSRYFVPALSGFVLLGCSGQLDVGDEKGAETRSTAIEITWGERTCPGPYAEGPYHAADVLFGNGKANVPLAPVFASETGTGMARTDVDLDGTPMGKGQKIVMCGVAREAVTRVTGTAPFTIEREFTWTGTRIDPCNWSPPVPPSACHVVQRIVYPLDVPSDAGL